MLLAITVIVILAALLARALRRLRKLEQLLGEIYVGVTPYVVASPRQLDKVHKQLVAGQSGNKLPCDSILPFHGDEEVYKALWEKRDFDKEIEEDDE